ncbi:MAG: hypothetical protein PHV82_16055 [Victivallaceae bacterium]|nr:hypothetical protein [Victivallaceae bacterium]
MQNFTSANSHEPVSVRAKKIQLSLLLITGIIIPVIGTAENKMEKKLPSYTQFIDQRLVADKNYVSKAASQAREEWLQNIKSIPSSALAGIGMLNQVPTIFINGKPVGPMMYIGPDHTKEITAAGINIHLIGCRFPKLGSPDSYYRTLDNCIKQRLRVNPSAWIILRMEYRAYKELGENYPSEVIRFEDGAIDHYDPKQHSGHLYEDSSKGRYSFASLVWEREAALGLLDLIRHVEKADYADRVIGYFPCAGMPGEWTYWSSFGRKWAGDFSPAMQQRFKEWLIDTYQGNVNLLRRAWHDDKVTFSTAAIPLQKERWSYENGNHGYFWDPSKDRKVIDYYLCLHAQTAERLIYLCRVVKKATGNRMLTGAFYGNICGWSSLHETGTSLFRKVINSDAVDFFSGPWTYENRRVGDYAAWRSVNGSMTLHNKMSIYEADTRTCFSGQVQVQYGAPETIAESISALQRDFVNILTHSQNGWWFDMGGRKTWYNYPEITRAFGEMQEIGNLSMAFDRRRNSEIAVIIDQDSILYASDYLNRLMLHRERIHELPRIGASCDFFEMDDIGNPRLQDYKLYIFLNCFALDAQERKNIEKLQKKGKVLLWCYAQGLINPAPGIKTALTARNVQELIGMEVQTSSKPGSADMKLTGKYKVLTDELPLNYTFGSFTRILTSGHGITPEHPVKLESLKENPQLYITDNSAASLAMFTDSGKCGFACKKIGEWYSIYAGAPCVPSLILRRIAKLAGVHLYVDNDKYDDIIYHNKSFLGIHTKVAGTRNFKLPAKSDVYDLFGKRLIAQKVTSFSDAIPAYTTKLYFIGNYEDLQAKMKSSAE